MSVQILHNPRCSKSRQTLALLQERGVEPEIIEYLSNPPTAARLGAILGMLGLQPRELMRTKEAAYKESGADAAGLSTEALIAKMVAHPVLIERPIVIAGGRAAVGRPPEAVLEIL